MSDQDLNPFDDQPAYGKMALGQFMMPGIIVEIEGADRSYQWDKQKAVGKGGASSVYKGEELAESIKVKCALVNAAHFAELAALRQGIIPPKGQKPSAYDVVNALLNDNGIKSVALKKLGQPKYEANGLWSVTFEFTEYSPPKPTKTGPAAGSKSASTTWVQAPVQDETDRKIDGLLKKAKEA